MSAVQQVIRFGDVEVDTRSGEFWRQGLRGSLPDQPFRVLMLLLQRPGQTVTRDELTKNLWPDDTFVDFERGLNKIINKLRSALGDDAGNPLYIETLPQRGYRFIAPLEKPAQTREPPPAAPLRGNFFRDKLSPPDLEKSIRFYSQAIDLDPMCASAYGALARCHLFAAIGGLRHPAEVFWKVKTNALKAIELDETVAAAHIALASVNVYDSWNWTAAEAESRRAVELNPGDPTTHGHLGDYLSIQGRHDEAIELGRLLVESHPLSLEYNNWLALFLYRGRRYDEAIATCREALAIDSELVNVLWFLALSLEQRGELTEVVTTLERAVSLSGGPNLRSLLGRAYALIGDRRKALAVLSELNALGRQTYVSPFDMSVIHLGLGDQTSVFDWLEEAYKQRVWRIIEINMPFFDSLRSDPRLQDLVRRIGLT